MKEYEIDTNCNLSKVKLWQYNEATKLNALIDNMQNFAEENVNQFWQDYSRDIFNIRTANAFGLKLWGIVLGIERPRYQSGGQTIIFNDEQYRRVLIGRLMLMNSNGSIKDINAYLNYMFPEKPVFAVDYHNMTINIVFYYTPTAEEQAVINLDGFLPIPAGVKSNVVIVPPDEVLGLYGQEMQTLDNSTFLI